MQIRHLVGIIALAFVTGFLTHWCLMKPTQEAVYVPFQRFRRIAVPDTSGYARMQDSVRIVFGDRVRYIPFEMSVRGDSTGYDMNIVFPETHIQSTICKPRSLVVFLKAGVLYNTGTFTPSAQAGVLLKERLEVSMRYEYDNKISIGVFLQLNF